MPTYRLFHKIRTVAEIDGSVMIEGFEMRAIQPVNGNDNDTWIAREDTDAPDFRSAFNASRPRLVRTVDALSVVTQCAFSLAATSFSVYRLTDNPEHIVYFRHLRSQPTVGMTVWKEGEQLKDISALTSIKNPGALHYFREAINASTPSAQLAMLVITCEALAGQSTVTGSCKKCGHQYSYGGTNRGELEAVLGAQAYDRLYRNHGSLRNKLLHGSAVDEDEAAQVSGLAYHAILGYLARLLGLTTIKTITGAPRTFQSFQWFGAFLRFECDAIPDLADLERGWQDIGERIDEPAGY